MGMTTVLFILCIVYLPVLSNRTRIHEPNQTNSSFVQPSLRFITIMLKLFPVSRVKFEVFPLLVKRQ